MFTEGTAVEVSFQEENHNVWHVGTVMKVTGINKCLVNFQCPGDGNGYRGQEFALSDVRPSPPCVQDNSFALREEVEAYFECCWWGGVIKKLLGDKKYCVLIKHSKKEMEIDHVNLRPSMIWADGKWSDEAKVANRPGMLTRQSVRLNRLKTRAEEQQSGNRCALTEKKDYTEVHVEEIVEKKCTTKEVDLSVKEVKGARSTKNSEVPQKKQSRDQEIPDNVVGSTEGDNIVKRKRGRPKKSKKQIGKRSTGGNVDMKAKSSAENFVTTVAEIPKKGDFQPTIPSKEPGKHVYKRSKVRQQNGVQSKTLDSVSHYQVVMSVNRQDDSETPPFIQENAMESAPLKKKDGPGGGLGTPAIVGIDAMENEQSLPFVKNPLLWEDIDSMETYKKMTQKPHFAPLYEHIEEEREGLAVGHIVNFVNLIEDISKLQFSSDIAVIERGLKSLDEYKSHGFDVEKVQASLNQLLLKKQQADEFQREYEDIRSKIANSVDNGELDEEISQLCQEFRETEKKLSEAKQKSEALAALQSKQDTLAENVKILQAEFESLVGSLL
ncbi:DUF724 domain-containing protein 6 isoform X1 [Daucus carota subsp. sativus]|uniref:DUF724 domain-containing protein 6 isoform X1 n=1 Tax=Daucus carota subsp. sativus TaxID=79200 RepID=UPI003082A402